MKKRSSILGMTLASSLLVASGSVFAYNSGSTGADGAFNPTVSQSIQMPPDGIFNYTTVNIPSGVIITYIKNAANTPVTILTSGDATIAGTINVSAMPPDGSTGVSGGGLGGPGGYNGGRGGQPGGSISGWLNGYTGTNVGRAGVGPGGGGPGVIHKPATCYTGYTADSVAGGGGAYASAPLAYNCYGNPGVVYGNPILIPLIGGSGGGGGAGGPMLPGSGGGGGGGAIVIASSGTLNVTGSILANGGTPAATLGAASATNYRGAYGGSGSGGAIRLIATTVSGNGAITAIGGVAVTDSFYGSDGAGSNYTAFSSSAGGIGRIRIEAENVLRTTATTPNWVGSIPSLIFAPGLPTLKIDSVGGLAVPAQPTGTGDVALPPTFTNPVTVTFVTTGVTVGSSILLTVIPSQGPAFSATSTPTTGTTATATTSVSVTLSPGPNTLQASVTYTVVASIGDAMSIYAQGERVEKVTLASTFGSKESNVTLTTVSGKQFIIPRSALALLPS